MTVTVVSGGGRPDSYEVAGERVPSVTEVCKLLGGDSDHLVDWGSRLARQGVDWRAERDRTANLGNVAHAAIELTIHGRPVVLGDSESAIPGSRDLTDQDRRWVAVVVERFRGWLAETGVRVTHTELPLVTARYRFGGTLDGYGVDRDGAPVVLDWKTSGRVRAPYLAQLGAYSVLLKENGLDLPRRARVVRISREDATLEHRSFSCADLRAGWELFRRLREVHDLARAVEDAVAGKGVGRFK